MAIRTRSGRRVGESPDAGNSDRTDSESDPSSSSEDSEQVADPTQESSRPLSPPLASQSFSSRFPYWGLAIVAISVLVSLFLDPKLLDRLGRLVPRNSSPSTVSERCLKLSEFSADKSLKLYTKGQLSKFTTPPTVLLAFLGVVYDVSNGHYYHSGGSYEFFSGKDATRAYLTGQFTEDELRDDISDLEQSMYSGIDTWLTLYRDKYKRVGLVVGSYYDQEGCPTETLRLVRGRMARLQGDEEAEERERQQFPPCNSKWNATEKRGRVWCSTLSGGVSRGWSGRPRLFYELNGKKWRCACVQDDQQYEEEFCEDPNREPAKDKKKNKKGDKVGVKYADNQQGQNCRLKLYDNCDPLADSCPIKD